MWQILLTSPNRPRIRDPFMNPPFEILIRILQFYQSYRALEYTLYIHDPIPGSKCVYNQEIVNQSNK